MKRIGILSVTFAAMLAVACGGDNRRDEANKPANDSAAVGTAGSSDANRDTNRNVNNGARTWLEDRMKGGMAEVKLGEMASQRAQNADVKAFGRMMVQDHTKANEELKQMASKHDIQPPVAPEGDQADEANKLSEKKGAEFDKAYMDKMVDDHQKTLNALEDRLDKSGDDKNPQYTPKKTDDPFDSELNQWAAKTAPTVQKHLDRAKQIQNKLDRRTTDNR